MIALAVERLNIVIADVRRGHLGKALLRYRSTNVAEVKRMKLMAF
jgi:hypothetical protein